MLGKGVPHTITADLNEFPVSACRAVTLEITWWTALQDATNKGFRNPERLQIPITVADSQFVQKIKMPKNGTIIFLSPCGGYTSPGMPSPDLAITINALITQVKAVKDAQKSWENGMGGKGSN